MISPICCFTKSGVNKWAHIPEMPPNQPDYPWFSKYTLNSGLDKPMLLNSTNMSHLLPFSHRSSIFVIYKCYIFLSNEFSYFVWNMFNSKTIKLCYIFSIHIQSYSVSSYWFILIKIYYICPILCFSKLFLE